MNPEETERLHTVAVRGSEAHLTYMHMSGIVREQQDKILAQLKSYYRADKLNQEKLLSLVGQLVALDDLVAKYKSHINAGNNARERLRNG